MCTPPPPPPPFSRTTLQWPCKCTEFPFSHVRPHLVESFDGTDAGPSVDLFNNVNNLQVEDIFLNIGTVNVSWQGHVGVKQNNSNTDKV